MITHPCLYMYVHNCSTRMLNKYQMNCVLDAPSILVEWKFSQFKEISFTGCTETQKVGKMTALGADIDENLIKTTAFTFPITFIFRK